MEICYLRQNGLCLQLNFVCFNSTNQIIFQGPSIGFGRRFDVLQKAVGDIHITSQMEFSRTGCLQMFPVGFSAEYGEPIGMLWNAKIWNQSAGEWTVITIGFRDSTWGFGWHFAGFYFADLFYFLWFEWKICEDVAVRSAMVVFSAVCLPDGFHPDLRAHLQSGSGGGRRGIPSAAG